MQWWSWRLRSKIFDLYPALIQNHLHCRPSSTPSCARTRTRSCLCRRPCPWWPPPSAGWTHTTSGRVPFFNLGKSHAWDLEATVKKCVFVEDWFNCLRESIFFGKSDSKRIGFPANHILSEISTVKNCIQICLPQDRFSGSCRDRNLNVAWGKHIPQEYDFPRTSVYYLRENRFNC